MQDVKASVATNPEAARGLINHCFPVADHLVSAAFAHATTRERESLLPSREQGLPPVDRLARFLVGPADGGCLDLGRLWLNARHPGRFKGSLCLAVRAQEAVTRTALPELVERGVAAGGFTTGDPRRATLHILVSVDGLGVYANGDAPSQGGAEVADVAVETAEARLGPAPGTLRARLRARSTGPAPAQDKP